MRKREEESVQGRVSRRGQSGEGRTRTESANVLFRGVDYCRLVVSSNFAFIDMEFQEGIGFSSLHASLLLIQGAWDTQHCERIKEKVQHVLHVVCC